jgi:alpha-L-fucosidase
MKKRPFLLLASLGFLLSISAGSAADFPPATVVPTAPASVKAQPVPIPAMAPGPFKPTWDSIRDLYKSPQWLYDAKFGLTMHWGIFSVPARQSEWYIRYMYGGNAGIMKDQIQKYGPLDKFGYKDFIPMFTAAKWDPAAWAALFKKSGAKFFSPTLEHHDGFSLWDSKYNYFNSKNMGPKRDIAAEISAAVRKEGLKFGVNNHSFEHFDFVPIAANSDQNDPEWREFYHTYDRSDAESDRFLALWVAKNFELIDKFQPDLLWFDNGVNGRQWDTVKLQVAAYYYNRALQWGKDVTLVTKGSGNGRAYLYGTVQDYERMGRVLPREIKNFPWEVDDPIGSKYGYVKEIVYKAAALLIRRIVDCTSMNGVYMLNLSPLPDGTIPQEQQDRLLEIGKWLDVNGEAIYGTNAWTRYGEGPYYDSPPAAALDDPPSESYTSTEFRFTVKGDTLYALDMDWAADGQAVITSLATGSKNLPPGKIEKVELLGHSGDLSFTQDAEGLKVKLPADKPCDYVFALKITGLKPKASIPTGSAGVSDAGPGAPTAIPQ